MKKKGVRRRPTRGDVLRINITPFIGKKRGSRKTFPWVRIFLHSYGRKHAARRKAYEEGPASGESKQVFAKRLGLSIIKKSKVLCCSPRS